MATIVFQAAGAVFGGLLGPFGAVAGRAIGALAGNALDGVLFSGGQKVKGGHLSSARIGGAEEGGAIPRVYGTARIGGTRLIDNMFVS